MVAKIDILRARGAFPYGEETTGELRIGCTCGPSFFPWSSGDIWILDALG
jgi:hypothetical protein